MSDQNLNQQPTRVVRIDKALANRIDDWAVSKGMTIREIMDAIVGDFLASSPRAQQGSLERWISSGRVEPASTPAARRKGPLTVSEWKRMCRAETSAPERSRDEGTSE